MTMREKALSIKTLVSMLQGLEGRKTTIEYRGNSSVTGMIDKVDGFMNIEMSDVEYVAASGASEKYSKYCCNGKFIRYVHIPEDVDPIQTIEERVDMLNKMRGYQGRGRGRGGRGRGGRRGSRGGGGGYGSRPSYSNHGYGGGSSSSSYGRRY